MVCPSWVSSYVWSPGPASQAQVMLCLVLSCHYRSISWSLPMSCEGFWSNCHIFKKHRSRQTPSLLLLLRLCFSNILRYSFLSLVFFFHLEKHFVFCTVCSAAFMQASNTVVFPRFFPGRKNRSPNLSLARQTTLQCHLNTQEKCSHCQGGLLESKSHRKLWELSSNLNKGIRVMHKSEILLKLAVYHHIHDKIMASWGEKKGGKWMKIMTAWEAIKQNEKSTGTGRRPVCGNWKGRRRNWS